MSARVLVALLLTGRLLSAQEIRLDDYLRQVRARHPVARQAQLIVDVAEAEVRGAGGAFEPSLSASWDSKTFGGKSYYDELGVKLSVPTALGVDFKLGYDRAAGANLNPESALPKNGLWSAGVSIPIGQRMLTDERRTAVEVARAGRVNAEGERTASLNKLTLTAAKDWALWYETERRATLGREGVTLAEFRLGAVRSRVRNGDAAGIDTVEALLEVERRTVTRLEADAAAYSARLAAGLHLWDEAGRAAELVPGQRPAPSAPQLQFTDSAQIDRWIALADRSHPDLIKLSAKVRQSEAQRTFAMQALLPAIALDLSSIGGSANEAVGASSRDFKGGASAKLAPLLVKDRAKFSQASAKLERDRLEFERVRRETTNAIRDAARTLAALGAQVARQESAVDYARQLRDGEQQRFDAGESSLLLVNLRERTLLDEQGKLAALEAKRHAAEAALAVAVGIFPLAAR